MFRADLYKKVNYFILRFLNKQYSFIFFIFGTFLEAGGGGGKQLRIMKFLFLKYHRPC
jgi:hypothetical protein